jgi:hypothetical protein
MKMGRPIMSENEGGESSGVGAFLFGFLTGVLVCLGVGGGLTVVMTRQSMTQARMEEMRAREAAEMAVMERDRAMMAEREARLAREKADKAVRAAKAARINGKDAEAKAEKDKEKKDR